MEPRDFRPTKEQLAFYEGGPRRLTRYGDRRGKRLATEMFVVAKAATSEDAKAALEDLRTTGIAMLSEEGKRVAPGEPRRYAAIKFDEEFRAK